MKIKTTCEHHSCEEESTHVAHWEEVGAPAPVFLCSTHAYRRRDSVQPRVESLAEYAAALNQPRVSSSAVEKSDTTTERHGEEPAC